MEKRSNKNSGRKIRMFPASVNLMPGNESILGGINGCGITPVSPRFTVRTAIPRIGKGQTAVQAEWGSY